MEKREKIRLSRPVIVRAALEIIDRDGLPGLSMRGLGGRLHVEGMTLYRYFPQKDAILDEVVSLALGGVTPPKARPWEAGLRDVANSLRMQLMLHPNVMPLVASRWSKIPVLRELEQAVIASLRLAGFSEVVAKDVMSALMSLVLGHAWIEVEGYVGELPDSGGLTRRPVEPVVPDQTTVDQDTSRLEFERSLDMLLRGVAEALG